MRKLLYLIPFALILSCSSKTENNVTELAQDTTTAAESITFSKEQVKLAGITSGKIKKQKISETIECTGIIKASPKNIASVSPIIRGFIKTLNYYPGDFVEKEAVLAYLQHPDFIILQQQYLEAKSQTEYYQEEYKRQGELTVENAASIKKLQKAKADYLSNEAKFKSLKSQLELLGIKPEHIEKGDFVKEFKLVAPIKGRISQLNANTGMFISPENCIYEIIDNTSLNLYLHVFEKDITKTKIGQKIMFWSLNDKQKYQAKIKRLGIKIDENNHTIMVYSLIVNKKDQLKPGMSVNASIYINERSAFTLPAEAIVDYNNESYIFIKKNNEFKITKIKKGIEQNNFFEILNLDDTILNAEIVLKGAYYLMAKIESGE